MRADPHAVCLGPGQGLVHHHRIAAMKAATDIRRGNDLHHFLILANLVLAETFTEIGIQVDMCHRRFLP